MNKLINTIVHQLTEANQQLLPIKPSLELEQEDLAIGYQIQQAQQKNNDDVCGWKIAFTHHTAQTRLQIKHPLYGFLTRKKQINKGQHIAVSSFIAPKLEVEIAVITSKDISCSDHYTDQQLIDYLGYMAPAFEIADCRWHNWQINATSFVADNAAASAWLLGNVQPFNIEKTIKPFCELLIDDELPIIGNDQGIEGGITQSYCYMVREILKTAPSIAKGSIFLTGTFVAPVSLEKGKHYTAYLLDEEITMTTS